MVTNPTLTVPKSAGVQAGRQRGRAPAGRRESQCRGSRSTLPRPAEPSPREQREGSYERSGRGARETTGTRPGRVAETSTGFTLSTLNVAEARSRAIFTPLARSLRFLPAASPAAATDPRLPPVRRV